LSDECLQTVAGGKRVKVNKELRKCQIEGGTKAGRKCKKFSTLSSFSSDYPQSSLSSTSPLPLATDQQELSDECLQTIAGEKRVKVFLG